MWRGVDPCQVIGKPSARIVFVELGGGDHGVDGGSPLATAVGADEQPGLSSDGDAAQSAFGGVVRKIDPPVTYACGDGGPIAGREELRRSDAAQGTRGNFCGCGDRVGAYANLDGACACPKAIFN